MRVCAFELLGEVVSPFDRIGGDDEILVGIERLSDHELIPVMIAADRGALVVHGPALKAFHALAATPEVTERLQKFSKLDVTLSASGNKMASQKVALADLLPASSRRPKVAWCASRNCRPRGTCICGRDAARGFSLARSVGYNTVDKHASVQGE
jgi:hypothetical protein